MSQPYVLPNRKAFADYIARIYLRSRARDRDPLDEFDNDADLCAKQGDPSKNTTELLPHQKLVRDYLLVETPYRGLLFYHGLGTGKTCSSIGVAESLLHDKKVVVMLPASLQDNFRQELRKCGDPIYMTNNHWQVHMIRTDADKAPAMALGISDAFLREQGRYFTTVPGQEPNYATLPIDIQRGISAQISNLIDQRYSFINYNGLNSETVLKVVPEEDPKTSRRFDNHVIIVDEIHNLISSVANKSAISGRLYDAIYHARNSKVVALSGTPVINRPNEIALLLNLLRGPIERIVLPVKAVEQWNESEMMTFFRALPDVDTIEFNSIKRTILLTRNPEHFKSVYNDKGDRIAVQYSKELTMLSVGDWVKTFKDGFVAKFKGAILGEATTEILEALPTKFDQFANTFLDGLNIKNPMMFARRIQGLVSYFKGADERMLPKRIDDDKMLEQIPMSNEQFNRYLEVRWDEIKSESRKALKGPAALDENFSSYRVMSRLVCNYSVPKELRGEGLDVEEDAASVSKGDVLRRLRENPDRYLSEGALATYSPKLQKVLRNLRDATGTAADGFRNQFIYSQYESLEGLGIFSAVLDFNGFQEYRLIKQDGKYIEDPAMDPAKPAYALYTGATKDTREIMRHIFNEDYISLTRDFPEHAPSIKESIAKRGGSHMLSILMGTKAAAEGLTLKNVRHIHILEPYWNPARHDQVIGRGIRICSHASRQRVDGTILPVPVEQRTIRISFYMSVFTQEQATGVEFPNIVPIRRADTRPKKYVEAVGERGSDAFMSSDEFLFEVAYEKERIAKAISTLLKQAAVDCEVHRKLHSRETPVIQCLRFDSTSKPEEVAFTPAIQDDEPDSTYFRNTIRNTRHLQVVKIKDVLFLIDRDSKEVFDLPSYQIDAKRLLKIGSLLGDRIQFFTYAQ
jgi:hypothetical protein